MKKLLLNSILLLCALIVGTSAWATDYSQTYNYSALGGMLNGSYDDATSYWKVPASVNNSATIAIPITHQPTSNITITFRIASFGSGTNPSSSNTTITAVGTEDGSNWSGSNISSYPSSSTYVNGAMTITKPDTPTTLGGLTVTMGVNTGVKIFRLQSITVSYTYTASSDPSSAVSFASSEPSLDLKDATTYTQVATTADGYKEAGGSVTYSITANSAGATINSSTGVVTLTQAGSVTVQAEAAAVTGKFAASYASYTLTVTDTREYTVTYHLGDNSYNVTRNSGAALNLEEPSAKYGMAFAGWSSAQNAASPTWVTNTTKVTGDMELYAIYEAVAGKYSYRLVESSLADWRGDYLIAYSSSVFANGQESGTAGIGSASTVVDPETNLSGKVVNSTWGDDYYVTLEAIDDEDLSKGYVLKTQDGFYNYQTSNGNGIGGTSKNKATAAAYPITVKYVSSSEINLELSTGPVFRYNSSEGYFRYYKSSSYSGMGKVYLYKRIEDQAPVYSLGKSLGTTESVTVSSSKYAAYCSSSALDFSGTDVKAYKAKVNEGKVVLTLVNYVPANEGVILNGDAGNYDVPQIAAAGEVTNNELIGVTSRTLVEWTTGGDGKYNYILQSGQFKKAQTGGYLKANRAYLHTSYDVTTASARDYLEFSFEGEEETTGVNEVTTTNRTNEYFNLAGQRVAQPTKGLYIVNGKKYVIK